MSRDANRIRRGLRQALSHRPPAVIGLTVPSRSSRERLATSAEAH
jgi:hypothetical protein